MDKTQYTLYKEKEEEKMKDKTQYTGTKREKRKRRIKHNTHLQIERREKR